MTNIRELYGKILAFRNSIVDKPVQEGGFEVKRFDKKTTTS